MVVMPLARINDYSGSIFPNSLAICLASLEISFVASTVTELVKSPAVQQPVLKISFDNIAVRPFEAGYRSISRL